EEVAHDYAVARERGDYDVAAVIAGEACALIHDIPPAGEIVERVVADAERLLALRRVCPHCPRPHGSAYGNPFIAFPLRINPGGHHSARLCCSRRHRVPPTVCI